MSAKTIQWTNVYSDYKMDGIGEWNGVITVFMDRQFCVWLDGLMDWQVDEGTCGLIHVCGGGFVD
jgi:hypothetical protein